VGKPTCKGDKEMKVRITKTPVSFWYADKLGEVFEVEERRIIGDYVSLGVVGKEHHCIFHEDCEVVE
jgi:hypothetical protein